LPRARLRLISKLLFFMTLQMQCLRAITSSVTRSRSVFWLMRPKKISHWFYSSKNKAPCRQSNSAFSKTKAVLILIAITPQSIQLTVKSVLWIRTVVLPWKEINRPNCLLRDRLMDKLKTQLALIPLWITSTWVEWTQEEPKTPNLTCCTLKSFTSSRNTLSLCPSSVFRMMVFLSNFTTPSS
jgi:hypothetical protein